MAPFPDPEKGAIINNFERLGHFSESGLRPFPADTRPSSLS
jgi:hypothetical protein